MGTLQRIAPIFAVHDLDAAMEHYRRLGFTVRAYSGGGYGFATRDGIELHLGVVPGDDRRTSSAYLFVDDADDLAAEWRSAGMDVHAPRDTEWGQHEGAVADPDGNVIRFGSPMAQSGGVAGGDSEDDRPARRHELGVVDRLRADHQHRSSPTSRRRPFRRSLGAVL